ncbi:MAG: DUF429 domain-containing protein [Capsulimonadales bacterium]|nr:DUF429 domain-containing protein [Capsulimonadales bacterium]
MGYRYLGIDLAWGERRTSAAVVLEGIAEDPRAGARFLGAAEALTGDDSIVEFVRMWDCEDGLLIGLDAPTRVPNDTGRRPCETVLSRCLRRQEAGPHPSNRHLLARSGTVRGERLVTRLATFGIEHTPFVGPASGPTRAVFEVFPHPAHIALFGLSKTLKYKPKRGRTRSTRLEEFRRYTELLRGLSSADPPLELPDDSAAFFRNDLSERGEDALKRHEDTLDALTCAYVALYRRRWGAERCPAIGDLTHGHIVVPATSEMLEGFRRVGAEIGVAVG